MKKSSCYIYFDFFLDKPANAHFAMPIVNRLKKFILGSNFNSDGQKSGFGTGNKVIPDIVRIETDVCDYWILDEVIGDGAFGNVYKARSKLKPGTVAAAKVNLLCVYIFFFYFHPYIIYIINKCNCYRL
ncbi:unnamed protein product, partial [Brugia timori]|uniref:Protein kinase domain-containing protein n=1 Tax=Brugia timori TaxID=42155 RepID=A0A0R3QSK4_9BILA